MAKSPSQRLSFSTKNEKLGSTSPARSILHQNISIYTDINTICLADICPPSQKTQTEKRECMHEEREEQSWTGP